MTLKRTAVVIYFICLFLIAYSLLVDPDSNQRLIQRRAIEMRWYQRMAEHFGRLGIEAETEYHSLIERERMI